MKKFFALVLVVAILCGLNVYSKYDGRVKNQLTGEVVDYPFTGIERGYYGRKAITVNDALEVIANHADVTVFAHNEFYRDDGECVVEIFGDVKKVPEIIIEDGLIQVMVDEKETETIQIDIHLDDRFSETKLKELSVTAERGDIFVDTRVTEKIAVETVYGDVDCWVVNNSSVRLKAGYCSVDPRASITDLNWVDFFHDDYVFLDKVYMPDVLPECFVEITTSDEVCLSD